MNEAADQATAYWLLDCSTEEVGNQAHVAEFAILGRQMRIQHLIVALGVQEPSFSIPTLDDLVIDFYDAMTGGNFQVKGRGQDLVRALQVQSTVASLNGAFRGALGVHIQGISSQIAAAIRRVRALAGRPG